MTTTRPSFPGSETDRASAKKWKHNDEFGEFWVSEMTVHKKFRMVTRYKLLSRFRRLQRLRSFPETFQVIKRQDHRWLWLKTVLKCARRMCAAHRVWKFWREEWCPTEESPTVVLIYEGVEYWPMDNEEMLCFQLLPREAACEPCGNLSECQHREERCSIYFQQM